uniref:Uncharacterized protein n=1 Tax=Pyropia yezoensis TaxID=2788 RepID=M4QTJ5_PYRYE|nr:hypothetical protein 2 [Neopyropia yezoensis]AGH27537.1 hypothetical protein 2 [Neopyropia yezoensis]QFZ66873.1 hypothetical protein PyyePp027 [Neopyropia yezoensis]WKD83368.1 hypothetical protein [Neopyropia yezoensis]BAE92337.1 unnamed protein product [Neopyropia yezoensis]
MFFLKMFSFEKALSNNFHNRQLIVWEASLLNP